MIARLRRWAASARAHIALLWWCQRHPDTPWYARALIVGVLAYAASPIDLIPDFIPVIGYLDDLVIVPLGIYLATRLVPAHVLEEGRRRAEEESAPSAALRRGGAVLVGLAWLAGALALAGAAWHHFR